MSWLSEETWLPPGVTWKQLEGENLAQFHHLGYPLLFAMLLIGLTYNNYEHVTHNFVIIYK
jgi:hypothetical protein